MKRPTHTIVAVPGSLRRDSINHAALRAAASVAAEDGLTVTIEDAPRWLPPFDPDLETSPPYTVRRFREACADASAFLFAVPEYTFGIPGAFKNALDWTVGSGSLYGKPVALVHVGPPNRGAHVREALAHVLRAHNAKVTQHFVPVARRYRDTEGAISNLSIVAELRAVVIDLARRADVSIAPADLHPAAGPSSSRSTRSTNAS